MRLRDVAPALKETIRDFIEDGAMQHAAALSFYAVLSLAPLLLVLVAVAALIFDREAVGSALVGQMRELVGDSGAEIARTVIERGGRAEREGLGLAIGLGVLVFGASGVFVQLQASMNTIWEVKARPRRGVWGFVRKRVISFGMLIALAFLLMISLAMSAALTALNESVVNALPGAGAIWRAAHMVASLATFALVFAAIFKYLPDVIIAWRDVWTGAIFTAVTFAIGKFLIGQYLGRTSAGSAYGAAGSIIVLLLWVYYSSVIVLIGAEFTQVHARRSGSEIRPSRHALPAAA